MSGICTIHITTASAHELVVKMSSREDIFNEMAHVGRNFKAGIARVTLCVFRCQDDEVPSVPPSRGTVRDSSCQNQGLCAVSSCLFSDGSELEESAILTADIMSSCIRYRRQKETCKSSKLRTVLKLH